MNKKAEGTVMESWHRALRKNRGAIFFALMREQSTNLYNVIEERNYGKWQQKRTS